MPFYHQLKSNLFVINELAKRLNIVDKEYFSKNENEMIFATLKMLGDEKEQQIRKNSFLEYEDKSKINPFIDGFAWPDKKFRFKPIWADLLKKKKLQQNIDFAKMPKFADYFNINELADNEHPFRLATSPARSYLNSSFTETPTSQKREGEPSLLIHPEDARKLNICDNDLVLIGNRRGEVILEAKIFAGLQRGVLIAESLHPNRAHKKNKGINMLTSSVPIPPFGGAAFHDCAVWIRKYEE